MTNGLQLRIFWSGVCYWNRKSSSLLPFPGHGDLKYLLFISCEHTNKNVHIPLQKWERQKQQFQAEQKEAILTPTEWERQVLLRNCMGDTITIKGYHRIQQSLCKKFAATTRWCKAASHPANVTPCTERNRRDSQRDPTNLTDLQSVRTHKCSTKTMTTRRVIINLSSGCTCQHEKEITGFLKARNV